MAGKGSHSPLLSIPLGTICSSTEGAGGCSSLPGSSPWLSSTGLASFPSTPQTRHGSGGGGQALSKPPAPSRGSSAGGMARVLLRNPHGCKVLGCWGVSWGASLQKKEVPWIWDHRGQRLELEGEASPLSAPSQELVLPAELALDVGGGETGARGTPPPCLCTVSLVGTSSLSPQESPQLSRSEGSIPGPSPGGQQTPPVYSSHIQLLLPFRCSQPLLSAPSSPHIPEPGELSLSRERPFPFASNFPRVGKGPQGSFLDPPICIPLTVPGAGSGLHVSTITSVLEPLGRSDVPGRYAALTALALL